MKTKTFSKLLSLLLALMLVVGILPATAMTVDTSDVTPTDYVLINGVKWATRNVAEPATFAATPEDSGLFYQWNSSVGWSSTDPLTPSDGTSTWNSLWNGDYAAPSSSDTWATAYDPSPTGYRVPTITEIQTLNDTSKVTRTWTAQNGVQGYRLTDIATGNSIFLPASGFRKNSDGALLTVGTNGTYWSSTAYYNYALGWNLDGGVDRAYGFSVRPVVASSNFAVTTDNSTANNIETLGLIGTAVSSSALSVATAAISNGYIAITSVSAGTATVTITDDASQSATIDVTVNTDGSVTLGTITKYFEKTNLTWYTGHETDTSFTINTGAELAGLASLVNAGADTFQGDTVTLGGSISLASYAWIPIGTAGHPFNGTFNGGTYSITGLAIGTSASPDAVLICTGLFGCTGATAEIRNVSLVDVAVYAGAASSVGTPAMVGGLVGNNGGIVTSCSVTGTVATTGEAAYVGGIAGGSTGPFSGCTSAATVTGADYVGAAGGIVGYTTASITDCSTAGTVSVGTRHLDNPEAGGIVGRLRSGDGTVKVSNCHATGAVSGSDYTYVGGIAGNCNKEILNCYATGNVSGGTLSMIGGLVGLGYSPITNSYATSSVTGGAGSGAGGLVGSSSLHISHCWASGNVTVNGNVHLGGNDGNAAGGLVGISRSNTISFCYATGNASGTGYVGGLIGNNKVSSNLTLTDCYATGIATGTEVYEQGGLISSGGGATMIKCYWNVTNSALPYGTGVTTGTPTGKTTAEMQTAAFAQLLTEGSGGNCSWIYVSGANNSYPLISGVGYGGLSGLAVSSGTLNPSFSSGTTDYTVCVDSGVENIAVTPTTSDTGAAITVNGTAVTSGNASGVISLVAGAMTDIPVVVTNGLFPITYTLHVTRAPSPSAPVFISDNHTVVTSGVGGTFQVTATGTGPITYSLSGVNLPTCVLIDSVSGLITISDTVTTADNGKQFTVTASNGLFADATQTFTLTVQSPAEPLVNTIEALGFDAAVNGNTVAVTGTKTAAATLALAIPSNITVIWKASLTGTVSAPLMQLTGDGTFELVAGEITNSTGTAILCLNQHLVISGGTVSAGGTALVTAYNQFAPTLTMTGGTVRSTSADSTDYVMVVGGKTVITGGTISAANGKQIYLNNAAVIYQSDLLSNIASDSLSASVRVESSKTYAVHNETGGLTATGYSGTAGNVSAHWAVLYAGEGTGIWIYYTINGGGSGSWRISYPDVKVVGFKQKLTYDANGGSGTMAGSTVYYGQSYAVSANAFTKSDFNFTGWNTQADGKGTSYAAGGTLTGTDRSDDIILYAQWSSAGNGNTNGSGGVSAGGSSSTTPTTAVSGSTATATVTSTVSGGKATGSVTESQMNDALKKAQEAAGKSGTPNVIIQITGTSGASNISTTIPQASMQALTSGNFGALTISGPTGSVSFGADALKAISGAASGDVTVTVVKTDCSALSDAAKQTVGNHPVFSLSVTSGGRAFSQFGGDVTVSVPYTPTSEEDTNAIVIYYIAADGTLTLVPDARYDAMTGTVIFTTTHFSTYAVAYNKVSFTDVSNTAWYADAVTFLAARGITSGTTAATFGPNATLTRGQFITMLLQAFGVAVTNPTDNFSDAGSTYYTDYLATAKALGITTGVGNNLFAPDQAITRQEMFTLLYNVLKVLDKLPSGTSSKVLADFTDASGIASWATDAMGTLVKTGTVAGDSGKLNPTGTTIRGEMAQVLYNLLGK